MEVANRPDQFGLRPASVQQKRHQPFFPVASHAPLWRVLRSSIVRGEGVILVTGADGAGKSLFLLRLQGILPENRDMTLFAEPSRNAIQFLESLIRAVDPEWESMAPDGLPTTEDLLQALEMRVKTGRKLLLAIDQAQALTPENASLLEMAVRHSFQETHPVQLILCGTQELVSMLDSSHLRSLGRLIIGTGEVTPLTRGETWDYLQFHLKKNWGGHYRISWFAWVEIFSRTQGNPGTINLILNQVAAILKIRPQKVINRSMVRQAVDGQKLRGYRKIPTLAWIAAIATIAVGGWQLNNFYPEIFNKRTDTIQENAKAVESEKTDAPKETEKTSEENGTIVTKESTGTPSRILYSPVAPPQNNKSNQPEKPWVPRDRRVIPDERHSETSAQAESIPPKEKVRDRKPTADERSPSETSGQAESAPPKEKTREKKNIPDERPSDASVQTDPSTPKARTNVADHRRSGPPSELPIIKEKKGSSEQQPAEPAAPIEAPSPKDKNAASEHRPANHPPPVGVDLANEKNQPVPVPKTRETSPEISVPPPEKKQAAPADDLPVPAPVAIIPGPFPVPKPLAVPGRTVTAAKNKDPLGQSVAALIRNTENSPSAPLPPPVSVKSSIPSSPEPPDKPKPGPKDGSSPAKIRSKVEDFAEKQSGNGAEKAVSNPTNVSHLVSEENLRSAGQLFVVQTGSFLNRENAERLVTVLAGKGLVPYVHLLVKDSRKWFSVRINYKDYKTAERMSEVVKKEAGLPTQVIDLFYE